MSNINNPGKQILAKITHSPKLVKAIITYDPSFTDTLGWDENEQQCFKAATISNDLSDKLFCLWLIARKIEKKPDIHQTPKIILPGL